MAGQSIKRCGGIIYNRDNDKVLVVLNRESHEKGENKWGFPKGHRNFGEKVIDCAKREIKEETGLVIPKSLLKQRQCINNTLYFIINLKQEYDNFNIIDKNEIVKVEWMSISDLKNKCYNRDIRMFIRQEERSHQKYVDPIIHSGTEKLYTIVNNMCIAI